MSAAAWQCRCMQKECTHRKIERRILTTCGAIPATMRNSIFRHNIKLHAEKKRAKAAPAGKTWAGLVFACDFCNCWKTAAAWQNRVLVKRTHVKKQPPDSLLVSQVNQQKKRVLRLKRENTPQATLTADSLCKMQREFTRNLERIKYIIYFAT